jgi:hypothetical protein
MNESFAQHSAQTPSPVDRLAAGDAQRRQRNIEREFRYCRERAAQLADDRAGRGLGFHAARLAPP